MSPPPDGPRARTFTRPPPPPADIEDRVRDLEHGQGALERAVGDMVDQQKQTNLTLDAIKTTLNTVNTEREAEKARSKFWGRAAVGLLGALALGLIGWLAKIALIVQSAKLP